MRALLMRSGKRVLIEHNNRGGKDWLYSDNEDGSGYNLLGLLLMNLRGRYQMWENGLRSDGRFSDPASLSDVYPNIEMQQLVYHLTYNLRGTGIYSKNAVSELMSSVHGTELFPETKRMLEKWRESNSAYLPK